MFLVLHLSHLLILFLNLDPYPVNIAGRSYWRDLQQYWCRKTCSPLVTGGEF